MSSSALSRICNSLKRLVDAGGFDRVLNKMEIVSVEAGHCICQLKVSQEHQNRSGILHGGMTSMLVDTVSTFALEAEDEQKTGVSVDMNITFLRPAKVGDELIIEAKALKMGLTLAFLTVDLRNKATNQLIAQARHTKYLGGSKPSSSV